MNKVFTQNGWKDYVYWQTEDKKILKKINSLIEDICRNGNEGIGKPEPLIGNLAGFWSRRINDKHRLIYKIDGNKIRVHETFDFCTLTVNGKIIDQCRRPIGRTSKQTAYHLKGTFKSKGKRISVEAKTKRSLLLLYYDGKLVKRQYIG